MSFTVYEGRPVRDLLIKAGIDVDLLIDHLESYLETNRKMLELLSDVTDPDDLLEKKLAYSQLEQIIERFRCS